MNATTKVRPDVVDCYVTRYESIMAHLAAIKRTVEVNRDRTADHLSLTWNDVGTLTEVDAKLNEIVLFLECPKVRAEGHEE